MEKKVKRLNKISGEYNSNISSIKMQIPIPSSAPMQMARTIIIPQVFLILKLLWYRSANRVPSRLASISWLLAIDGILEIC